MDGFDVPMRREPASDSAQDVARVARERARELTVTALRLLLDLDPSSEEAASRCARAAAIRDKLREIVDTHARTMRAMGEPPERVIIVIKAVVDSAVSDLCQEGKSSPQLWDTDLRTDVVQWTIAAYYNAGRAD